MYSIIHRTGWAGLAESWYGVLSLIAYCLVVDSWRCKQSRVSHIWNTFDSSVRMPARPGFDGFVLKNPITGKIEVDFPEEYRATRFRASCLLTSTMMVSLLGTITAIFAYKAILARSGASSTMLLLPAALNAVQISVFGMLYKVIGVKLTDHENHRTIMAHNSALFAKLSVFYFVNNFATLFYIAFIKSVYEGCHNPVNGSTSCRAELSVQVRTTRLPST